MTRAPAYVVVIPARYDSQRLPGKALLDIGGRPMIQHVWERAQAAAATDVVVATDDDRIEQAVREFGGEVVRTSRDHASGSDRIAECARVLGWSEEQIIVNLQGDEPEMPAACLDQVAGLLVAGPGRDVATLCWPIDDAEEINDPNAVKVVFDHEGLALYFSRATIPHPRGHADHGSATAAGIRWYRHLGLYAYRNSALQAFTRQRPSPLERAEKLEQLRFLEHGRRIAVEQARVAIPGGIDTPEDLERVRRRFDDSEDTPEATPGD